MPKIVEVPGVGNVEFPDELPDQVIARTIRLHTPEPDTKGSPQWVQWRTQRQQDLTDAATGAHQPTDKGFLRGLWDSINPFPAIGEVLVGKNPETGKFGGPMQGVENLIVNTGRAQADQARKAIDAGKAGDHVSAGGHALAAALPLAGPAAANAGEAIGEGRTGEGLGQAIGLLATVEAPRLARGSVAAIDKVAPALRPAMATALRENAETQYARVLAPTTKANKLRTAEVVPELIDRGLKATTLRGLQLKAAEQIARAGQAIGNEWENLPAGTSTPLRPIFDKLQREIDAVHSVEAADRAVTKTPAASGLLGADGRPVAPSPVTTIEKGGLVPKGPVAAQSIGNIEALQKTLQDVAETDPATGQMVIPVDKLRGLRQYFDAVQKSAGAFDGTNLKQQSIAAAHQVTADAIRAELGKQFPDIDALNKEFSFWKDVHQIVSDTLGRKQGQAVPLTAQMAQAAGLVKGGVLGAEAMKTLTMAMRSPAWGTVAAIWKDRLADAIAKGARGPAEFAVQKITADPALRTTGGGAAPPATITPDGKQPPAAGAPTAAGDAVDSGATQPRAALPQPVRTGAETAPGARTSIDVPGEARTYGGTYEVRDLADLQPSHVGATFQPNPKYGLRNDRNYDNPVNQAKIVDWSAKGPTGFKPANLVNTIPDSSSGPPVIDSYGNVLGGNGRTMILQRVAKSNPEGAAAYRALLDQQAGQFGIDPASYAHLKQPVLVRVLDDAEFDKPGAKQAAVTDFNKTGTAALTPAERSIADSRRVSVSTLDDIARRLEDKGTEATLAQVLEGRAGIDVLSNLVSDGVISPQERAALTSEDKLTKAGKDRISGLMLGRFFSDPAQMETIAPSVRNKVERIAAPLARTEGAGGFDLAPDVRSALDLVEDADAHGAATIDDHIAQNGLFGEQRYSPQAIAIARHLKTAKPTDLTNAVRKYADHAKYSREYQGPGMFGDFPDPLPPPAAFIDAFGTPSGAAAGPGSGLSQ